MKSLGWLALVALAVGSFAGCDSETTPQGGGGAGAGGSDAAGATGPGEGLPCEIDTILRENCRSCHGPTPKFGAPMSLVDRADLLATPVENAAPTVGEAVLERIDSASDPMPPPPDMSLTQAQKDALQAYVDAGMPESDESCGEGGGGEGGGGEGGGYVLGCEPDVLLVPPEPFEMPADQDDLYVCFGVEAPSDVARHITAIAPMIDNDTIIHHMLLLQAPEAVSAQGEPCDFVNLDWKLIYAWGPGTPALELPEAAGFPIGPDEPGHFVLQMHYSNLLGLEGETDASAIGLCTTTELREFAADIAAFGGTSFTIDPNSDMTLDCNVDVVGALDDFFPVTIFQSWPHMHQLGRGLQGHVEKADGTIVPLADVPNYDFDYQITYPVNVTLDVGDTVHTSCTWENTTGSPVGFGEATNEEMCFNFVSYYPRVEFPQWHWLLPSYSATCAEQ